MPIRTVHAPDETHAYTKTVLDEMLRLVPSGMNDPTVRNIANRLRRGSDMETLGRDFEYLQSRIPYKKDPPTVERIYSAKYTVGRGYGEDCDGMSVAIATVLTLQNIPWFFRAIAWRKPEFSHVYTVAVVNGKQIPFDLTLASLGDERNFFNKLDTPMQTIQSISDVGPLENIVQQLFANNLATQRAAYNYLASRYPREMQLWAVKVAQENLRGRNLGLSDRMGDWLSSVLSTVSGLAANIFAPGSGTAVASLVGSGLDTSTSNSASSPLPDPKRPGRSTTDARTYMDELTAVYDSGIKPQGNQNVPSDFATVIHVPTLPYLDQHIDTDHPGHIFLSWDGGASWISIFSQIKADPVGDAYKLSYILESGGTEQSPNYYTRTQFSDGAERFDNIGPNPSRAKPVQTKEKNTSASTAETGGNATSGPAADIPPGGESAPAPGTTQPTKAGGGADVLKQAQSMFGGANMMPLLIGGGILLGVILLSKK